MDKETAGRPVILVVDDMHDVREILRRFLEGCGYQVLTADGGRAAVSVALTQVPDLILMDIYMSGGDGLTAARQIHTNERMSAIPIIAISGYGELGLDADLHRQALSAGCIKYMPKPINLDELREVVERELRGG